MIKEIKNNNTFIFECFFNKYADPLFFYFLKKTKSYPDAEELTQLTFIKFWEYRASLSEELPEQVQLFHKAKLVFIDWLRKQTSTKLLYKKINENSEESYSEIASIEEADPLIIKLRNTIDCLPEKRKKIFELFQFHGYSYKQIAQKFNISTKTVDNHIYQAMKQLRKALSLLLFSLF